ncbi:hypothetical protein [Nostoc sp. C052]|nr:hypothetical protein [Nostoc sp. C052]
MLLKSGSAASKGGGASTTGIPGDWERGNLKASSRLAFTLS